jgi:hypothetical protein
VNQRSRIAEVVGAQVALLRQNNDGFSCLVSRMERQAVWAVVGGAPRTWFLSPGIAPRDVDIVVDASPDALALIVERLAAEDQSGGGISVGRTSLGGYRLALGALAVDVWALCMTHGIASGLVDDSDAFRGVASSAAITIDSLVVTSNSVVYEKGFLDTVETGVLRLTREGPVVNPGRIARKSVQLCQRYELAPDKPLRAFISTHLASEDFAALASATPEHWPLNVRRVPGPFVSD